MESHYFSVLVGAAHTQARRPNASYVCEIILRFILLQCKEGPFLTSVSEAKGARQGFGYSCVIQLCSDISPASYTMLFMPSYLLQNILKISSLERIAMVVYVAFWNTEQTPGKHHVNNFK